MEIPFGLDENEINEASRLLAKLKPGYLPRPLFYEIARLTALPVVEIVPVRRTGGVTEVLLTQRLADDPFWPGAWHNPGAIVRAGDSLETAVARILSDDIKGAAVQSGPVFVDTFYSSTKRGYGVAQIYWIELGEDGGGGTYFPAGNLPANMIGPNRTIVEKAIAHYESAAHDRIDGNAIPSQRRKLYNISGTQ